MRFPLCCALALLTTLPALAQTKKDAQLPARTEAQILKSVKLPDGYAATVFALAPRGGYPTSVSAAIDGTIFVAIDENGSLGRDRNTAERKPGKVVRMRDTDGDGRADEFKTFAEMESPRGVIWDGPGGAAPGTLYVMYPPKLTAFHDTDGDGVSDRQEDILTGLGFGLDFRGADHTTNGCRLAIDGFIYIAVGDYGFTRAVAKDGTTLSMRGGGIVRVRPDGTGFEIVSRGQRNIYDVAVSPTLDLFTRDNTNDGGGWNVRLSHVPPGAHMGYPFLFKNFPEDHLPALADLGSGSPCGALWLDEPGLPRGLFTVEWGAGGIMYHDDLAPDGAGWKLTAQVSGEAYAAEGKKTPTVKQNKWIGMARPTDMDADATGAIFITSWEGATFTYNGPNAGYVLRVVKKDAPRAAAPDLGKATNNDLARYCFGESATMRLNAGRELIRRGDVGNIYTVVMSTFESGPLSPAAPTNSTCLMFESMRRFGLGKMNPAVLNGEPLDETKLRAIGDSPNLFSQAATAQITPGLADSNPRIRAAAITALRRLGKADAAASILPLVADEDRVVAHLAVRALSELRAAQPCLAALDAADATVQAGALRALYGIYTAEVVDGLIARLGSAPVPGAGRGVPPRRTSGDAPDTAEGPIASGASTKVREGGTPSPAPGTGALPGLRRGILNALCRLVNQDAPYEDPKVWWGTRPDTSGPVYQPIAWSETPKIVAALRAALETSGEDDARWLVTGMYQCKVAFPGLIELMLSKAGDDTPAKLAALEGMIRADHSLPPEGVAALQAIAADERQTTEWRVQALRIFQRCAEHGSVFPGAALAFAPLAERELPDEKIASVFEDFTRGAQQGKWVGEWAKMLAAPGPRRALAATVLVNLSTGRVGKEQDREAARQAVEKAWPQPESAAALLAAIARTGAQPYAGQVKAHLDHPNHAVAESALFAFQKLGLGSETKSGKTIAEMKYEEVFAAVQKGGDARAGKDMFLKAACIACHTVQADEPPKGPVLSAAAKIYDRAALTESILKPHAKLAQGFESTWIKTRKGEQLEGFVTREGGDNLDLRNIAGQTVLVEKADIAERGHREQSMMPEGLMNPFTPADLASLLAWLESLK